MKLLQINMWMGRLTPQLLRLIEAELCGIVAEFPLRVDQLVERLELEGNCDLRGVGKRSRGFGEIVRGCFDFDSLCRDIAEFSICGIAEI